MKTFLIVLSGLILVGCFLSWLFTSLTPGGPLGALNIGVAVLIATVLFCAAAVIRAIERLTPPPTEKKSPPQ